MVEASLKYVELVGGLLLLIFAGDYLVKGGIEIARRLRISSLVVGMTVVAFGTSAPELLVSVQAAVSGNPEIAIGNVVGSNIANIGLILGITALLLPIPVNPISVRLDGPVLVGVSLLFWGIAANGIVGRTEGVLLFILLLVFVGISIRNGHKAESLNRENTPPEEEKAPSMALWKALGLILLSAVGLTYGAKFLVSGASQVAVSLGVSQRVIGVTIVAFGTSVPELAASIAAALRKEMDISIGNIIGSNIFNILCVIGLSSAIHPISIDFTAFNADFCWMVFFAILLLLFMLPWKKILRFKPAEKRMQIAGGTIGRISGLILLLLYLFYVIRLF